MDLRGKRALVMGLGLHGGGLGVARFLVGQGADVTVTDLHGPDALKPALDALAGLPIRYVLGEHRDADFCAADLVIRNPAVPRESRYLQIAYAAGAAIEMEMTLFFRLCRGPILGITGTKGKTTTTLLTGAMLRAQYPHTIVAGNLRVSALEALPRITAGTPVVLELSSWQLEGLGEAHLSPQYACITNISADHLNRYASMADYAEAKKQIFRWQPADGVAVLNADDLAVARWAGQAPGQVVWFSAQSQELRRGALGAAFVARQGLWWSAARTAPDHLERICGLDEIALLGQHNVANVAAAAALAKAFGIETEYIRGAIRNFAGVPHRLELVRELGGVHYINDTTATAPEATVAALQSFDAPIILIAGGTDKNLPFEHLAQSIVERAKAVVLLDGTATPKLQQSLHDRLLTLQGDTETTNDERRTTNDERHTTPQRRTTDHGQLTEAHPLTRSPAHPLTIVGPFDDLAQAIGAAHDLAEPGDVVLLSPGCASFGMFLNEFHRGDEFKRIVNEL